MALQTVPNMVPTCTIINTHRASKGAKTFQGSGQFLTPICYSCEFVSVRCQSNKINASNNNPIKYQYIKKDHIQPGNMVSADHYILQDTEILSHTRAS